MSNLFLGSILFPMNKYKKLVAFQLAVAVTQIVFAVAFYFAPVQMVVLNPAKANNIETTAHKTFTNAKPTGICPYAMHKVEGVGVREALVAAAKSF